jgi:hypothetical protein
MVKMNIIKGQKWTKRGQDFKKQSRKVLFRLQLPPQPG